MLIERYLAAELGTIFLILVWCVFCINLWLKWFYFGFLVVLISYMLSSDSDDSFIKLPQAFSVLFAARIA